MEVKAKLKYIKTAPRKVRLVLGAIRGLGVEKALNQLKFLDKKVAHEIKKLLDSAISNAVNNFELERSNLFIKEITGDDGPTLKRWAPKARGRATPVRKRTTHVNLILGELVDSGNKEKKEIGKKISDPRGEGKGKNTKIEGNIQKNFVNKIFRRKSG